MTLECTDQERELLLEVLQQEIPELRDEIWHTEDHDYREYLKERERRLQKLISRLTEVAAELAG